MAYDKVLADRLRTYLIDFRQKDVTENRMFGGLAFMVDDKMCINVSGNNLMCRIDPEDETSLSTINGYRPMIMISTINQI